MTGHWRPTRVPPAPRQRLRRQHQQWAWHWDRRRAGTLSIRSAALYCGRSGRRGSL